MIWSQNSRAHMSLISPGPWLDDVRPTYSSIGLLTVGILCLVGTILWWVLAPHAKTSLLMGVLPFVGLCGVIIGIIQLPRSLLQRRWKQTCPECLRSMDRGATTCPYCQFHPPQEDA